jgi:multiple sugar transport system substrate-binding protein
MVNAPKTIEAIKWYKSLFDKGVAPKGVDSLKLRELFWEGKLGMTLQGPWGIGQIKNQNPQFEMGTAPCPWANGRTWISVVPFVIPKDAKNKEEAWNFLALYAEKKWQERYIEMTGIPTGRSDLADSRVVEQEPLMKPFMVLLGNPENKLRTVQGFETDAVQIYSMLEDTMTEILIEKVSVEEGLNTLQKQLEEKFY